MSDKNFMVYGDAETILTGFATDIKAKQPKTLETPITIGGVQKTTVEGALQGLVGSVADGKALVASAITNKGIQTSANDTLLTMANNIASIPQGIGNVTKLIIIYPITWSSLNDSVVALENLGTSSSTQSFRNLSTKSIYIKKISIYLKNAPTSEHGAWSFISYANSSQSIWNLDLSQYSSGSVIEKTFAKNQYFFWYGDLINVSRFYSYGIVIELW